MKRLLSFLVALKPPTLTMGRRKQATFGSSIKVHFIFVELSNFFPRASTFPL